MHLRTRLTLGVAATIAAVGASLIPATNAFAAAALTATPSTSLFENATTMVSGSGFTPGQAVALAECNYARAQALGLSDPNTLFAACDTDHAQLNAGTADAQGNFGPVAFTVHVGQTGTDAQSICNFSTNGQCVIAAGDPNTLTLIAAAPIAFSDVVATPSANLTNGQAVSVTGQGLPASTQVVVVECNVANGQDQAFCDTSGAGFGATDASGNLPAVAMTAKSGQIGSDPDSDCNAGNNGACGFAVADPATMQPLGFAGITFAVTHSSTALTITATKGKVDKGEKFAIKGRDTAAGAGVNGVTLKLQSRSNTSGKWSKIDEATTKSKDGKAGYYKFGGLTEGKTKYYRVKSVKKTTAATIYDAATSPVVKVKFAG
jgi:hypothetical protein